jgi:hypothetical protein
MAVLLCSMGYVWAADGETIKQGIDSDSQAESSFAGGEALGRLHVLQPNLIVTVRTLDGGQVFQGRTDNGHIGDLEAGTYEVLARLPEDPYDPFKTQVVIANGQTTSLDLSKVILSTLHRYEVLQNELELLKGSWAFKPGVKIAGMSALGVGVAGLAASVLSYVLYSKAQDNYDNAVLTSDCERYRNEVIKYSKLFTASLSIGLVAGVAGGTVLAVQGFTLRGLSDQIKAKEKSAADLKAQLDAEKNTVGGVQ